MEKDTSRNVVFVMGVSGSGKSTIGQLLSKELSIPFIDADDHHTSSNVMKMSNGNPLTDDDRKPWLNELNRIARSHIKTGCIIGCSALKEGYRMRLSDSIESSVDWVYLQGTFDQIHQRMKTRTDHFMDAKMLRSQFETLEEPTNAIRADISETPEVLIGKIISLLK